MRLINSKTLDIRTFYEDVPEYAILSHTWGEDEVSFQDMQSGKAKKGAGYAKVELAAKQAATDNLNWIWIDTCCIDKTSSAELSEAINSMYQWYKGSVICYAYLPDVLMFRKMESSSRSDFPRSRWFTRGWTLQELIAPKRLIFYGSNWTKLGLKEDATSVLSTITGIDELALAGGDLRSFSIARRMSWAASRTTTRVEDIAYCLLGIFDVNMSLLYGEGPKAFVRLQEEIIKSSNDQSIFAWDHISSKTSPLASMLAPSPIHFLKSGIYYPRPGGTPHSFTNMGLSIKLPILPAELLKQTEPLLPDRIQTNNSYWAVLRCTVSGYVDKWPAVPIQCTAKDDLQFRRLAHKGPLRVFDAEEVRSALLQESRVWSQLPPIMLQGLGHVFGFRLSIKGSTLSGERYFKEIYPPAKRMAERGVFQLQPMDHGKFAAFRLMEYVNSSLVHSVALVLGLDRHTGVIHKVEPFDHTINTLQKLFDNCDTKRMFNTEPLVGISQSLPPHIDKIMVQKLEHHGQPILNIEIQNASDASEDLALGQSASGPLDANDLSNRGIFRRWNRRGAIVSVDVEDPDKDAFEVSKRERKSVPKQTGEFVVVEAQIFPSVSETTAATTSGTTKGPEEA